MVGQLGRGWHKILRGYSSLLLLRARRDEATIRFRTTQPKLSRCSLQRCAIVQAFSLKRIDTCEYVCFRFVLACFKSNTRAVYQENHLAARGFFLRETCGQLAQTPA